MEDKKLHESYTLLFSCL